MWPTRPGGFDVKLLSLVVTRFFVSSTGLSTTTVAVAIWPTGILIDHGARSVSTGAGKSRAIRVAIHVLTSVGVDAPGAERLG